MKKKWTNILCVVILFSILAGSVSRTENVKDAGVYEYKDITWYSDVDFWDPPEWDTAEGTIMGDISKKTGVRMKIEIPEEDADTRLKWMLINDELPDVISIKDETTGYQLATSGKVWKIDEFLKTYKPDSHLLESFPEDIKQAHIRKYGGWYAISSHIISEDAREEWKQSSQYWIDRELYGDNSEIIWNKSLLEQLQIGEDEVHTEEEILTALKKAKDSNITVDGQPVIPLLLDGLDYYTDALRWLLETFGAEYINEEGEYTDCMLQPETKNALHFLNAAVQNGYMQAEDFTLGNSQIRELCLSGRVLCFIGNIADIWAAETDWISSGAILASSGSTPVHGRNLDAQTGWIKTFISKDCKNPEKIADWIDYMTSDEGLLFWNFGYKDVDYTIGDDGLVYRTREGELAEASYRTTGMTAWWPFVNTAWQRSVESGSREEKYGNLQNAYGKDENTVQYNSALFVFPKDLFPAESEELKMEQAINEWKKEKILSIIVAKNDAEFEAEYKKFINGLYDRGIQKIDMIKNKAYKKNCMDAGECNLKINESCRTGNMQIK